jgi:hypothetical protein
MPISSAKYQWNNSTYQHTYLHTQFLDVNQLLIRWWIVECLQRDGQTDDPSAPLPLDSAEVMCKLELCFEKMSIQNK